MTFAKFKTAFAKAGGCQLLPTHDDAWLAMQQATGRKPDAVAALTRRVDPWEFESFVAAVVQSERSRLARPKRSAGAGTPGLFDGAKV